MQDPPSQFKSVSVMNLIAGLLNMSVGTAIAFTLWTALSVTAATCFTTLTLGLCPLTWLLPIFSFVGGLVFLVGGIEAAFGLAGLVAPDMVKGVVRYFPIIQFPAILLGDIISPIVGGVSLVLLNDPQVKAYIQG